MTRLAAYFKLLETQKVWGEVRVQLKNGEVVKVTTAQDHLIDNLPGTPQPAAKPS